MAGFKKLQFSEASYGTFSVISIVWVSGNTMKQLDKRSQIFCFFGHGVNDLFFFVLPLVLPLILQSFSLKYSEAGGIITLFLSTISVCSFILGKIAKRISRRIFLSAGFFIASTGMILSGFMPSLSSFLVFLILTAVGVSTFHPIIYAVVDENTQRDRGVMFGRFEFWGTLAILFMFMINGFLLSYLSWQTVLIFTAIPGMIAGGLYLTNKSLIIFAQPEIKPQKKEKTTGASIPSRIFIFFLASIFLRIISVTAILNFLPTLLVMEKGVNSSIAAYATAFFCVGGMLSVMIVGKAGDRWGAFPVLMATILGVPIVIYFLVYNSVFWIYPLIIFFFGALASGCTPAQNMLLTRLSSKKESGEAFGSLMAGMTIGNAFGPIALGFLADHLGLSSAMLIFILPVVLAIILLVLIGRSPYVKSLSAQDRVSSSVSENLQS